MQADEFLTRLRFSRILTAEKLTDFVDRLLDDERTRVDLLAQRLTDARLLTPWQVKQLRSGNDKLVFGNYRLLDQLGKGGMGVVYLAEHMRLRRKAALKTITPHLLEDPNIRDRFLREAQVSSSLRHQNLVTTFDLDEAHGQFYMAMEFVEGTDLGAYVAARGPLPADTAIKIISQVAAALECAWKHGIVHRDIKPNNILVSNDGRAVLLDLGLAKIHDHTGDMSSLRVLTSTHYQLGTPEYMSPEQFDSSHGVDIRSDIYSLGCTLYAILTRRHPFEAHDRSKLERLHREATPKPLRELRSDIPPDLASLVARMMAKRPDDRFATPTDLIAALEKLQRGSVAVPPPPSGAAVDLAPSPLAGNFHEFVTVPAGRFLAGCTRDMANQIFAGLSFTNQQEYVEGLVKRAPYRPLELDSFEIARYPVTNQQYAAFLSATGHPPPPEWNAAFATGPGKDRPVVYVTLHDARDYCRWAGVSLPTPSQWEKAARGTDGRIYSWGSQFDSSRCHCNEQGHSSTAAVDDYAAGDSPYGVRQAVGNIWEWVDDPASSPEVRGGSFQSSCQLYGAVFNSMAATPDVRREHIGFRVARSLARTIALSANTFLDAEGITELLRRDCIAIPHVPFVCGLDESMLAPLVEKFRLSPRDAQTLVGSGARIANLPPFRISRHCVTNAQYLAFVRAASHRLPAHWAASLVHPDSSTTPAWDSLPVTGVSRDDALAFCRWSGVRLPTNDEWELAARGEDGRLYPWGNQYDPAACNGSESGREGPVAVDALPQGMSPFGLLNTTGNVFEWVDDVDPETEFGFVRGGSYESVCEVYGLCGFRMFAQCDLANDAFGFRVAANSD